MMRMETELQIEQYKIPNLIPAKPFKIIDKIIKYNGDDLTNYFSELGYTRYIIDQFDKALQINNQKLKLLDSGYWRLKKEANYISFCNEIFINNDSKVFLFNLGVDFSNIETCIDKIERLDKIDQYIILNLHKTYVESEIYSITDKTLFEFFIKGFLREAISGILFFEKQEIFLSYGYDMALPIFFKDINQVDKLKNKAKQFNIYLRN